MSSHLSRRDFLYLTSTLMAAGIACNLLPKQLFASSNKKQKKKNILFIICDDLKPALNCYGYKQVLSQNIDRLAHKGIVFDNNFCQYPVCGPSRQSFLSGMRPNSTGVYGNELVTDEQMRGKPSLPKYLKDNGYYTMSVGKVYHNPTVQDLGAWSEAPQSTGTHIYKLQKNIDKMAEIEKKGIAEGKSAEEIRTEKLVACTEDADVSDEDYTEGQECNMAIGKLRQRAIDKSHPFFLAVGFYRPHYPFVAPKKYWDMYDRSHLNLADNPFRPKNAKYILDKNYEPLCYGDVPKKEPFDEDLQRRMLHGYYACISYVDAQVGKLLDELDSLKLADDTIIIFIGDNGFHLGDHGLWGKFTHFEETARVPLIISVPGMTSSKHSPALAEFVDIYPTLCELNGLSIPKHTEGSSLMPVLQSPSITWKRAAFTQYNLGDAWGLSLRIERYRFTKWTSHKTAQVLDLELYDHAVDPEENENIAHYPQNEKIVEELQKIMHAGWKGARPKV